MKQIFDNIIKEMQELKLQAELSEKGRVLACQLCDTVRKRAIELERKIKELNQEKNMSQIDPSKSIVIQNTSTINLTTTGIEVPDYEISPGTRQIARGTHTQLVNQRYVYDDKINPANQEYREYLQLRKMAAAILPMCPRESKYLLIRQFRYPAFHNAVKNNSSSPKDDGWLYEIIAGVIELGDTAEQTAIREAQEEGGITLGPSDIRNIHNCFMTPGITNEEMSIFLAIVDKTVDVGQVGLVNQGEHIRAKWMTAEEIKLLHSQGLIRDAKTLIALYAARVL